MMKTKILIATMAAAISVVPAVQAQLVVEDPLNLVQNMQQAVTLAEQLAELQEQLSTMKDQLDTQNGIWDSMTGSNGYGGLLPNNTQELKENLPEDFDKVYADAMNNNSALSTPAKSILGEFDQQITSMDRGDALAFISTKLREKGAYDRAMASQAYNNQMRELNDIQALTAKIDTTTTAKQIMDLQARIGTAQGAIQGEQAKLQLMSMLQQSQSKLLDQQQELAVRRYTIGTDADDNTPPRMTD